MRRYKRVQYDGLSDKWRMIAEVVNVLAADLERLYERLEELEKACEGGENENSRNN